MCRRHLNEFAVFGGPQERRKRNKSNEIKRTPLGKDSEEREKGEIPIWNSPFKGQMMYYEQGPSTF